MRRTLLTAVMIALAAGAVVYGAKFKSTWRAPDVDRLNFAGKKVAAVVYGAKFKSTWRAPDVDRLNFAGKKVAAVVISPDQDLQISAEEELARQLTALGVQGVPSYRLVPKEVLQDKVRVKEWFQQSGTAGLVVIRVVSADKEITYTPDVWVTSMYASPWDYYAYGWGSAIGGVSRREELVVTIETMVYSVPLSKLVWAGVSEKTNPKDAQKIVKELLGAVVSEMRKQGLVPKGTP